jgi:hypothetical protein
MSRFPIRAAMAALLLLAAAPLARAHAFLDHTEPTVGGTVAKSPPALRLWFTEALEPAFSTIALADAAGKAVPAGKATVDAKDKKLLELALPPLPPGTYRVTWRVVSVDTHPTEGNFTFTVKP